MNATASPGEHDRQQIEAARAWISDCDWPDLDDGEFAELSPNQIHRGIRRHYDGGWAQFVTDSKL